MTTTATPIPAPAEGELPRLRLDTAPLLVLPILIWNVHNARKEMR